MALDISVVFVKHWCSSVFLQYNGCVKTSNSAIKKFSIFLQRFAALASWVHTSVYSLYSLLMTFYRAVDITFQGVINCVKASDKLYNMNILLKLDFPDRDSSSHRYL